MLIKDLLSHRNRKGEVGLELEVEAEAQLPQISDGLWTTKSDPSLHGIANEYLSPIPLSLPDACKGIRGICWELGQKKYKVNSKSPRTSLHVHRNVLHWTPVQYWTAVLAYWLLEDLLYNYVDTYRKGNCYCLRLSDAEGVLTGCLEDLRKPVPFKFTETIRYGGQNLYATVQHGSIEYRALDGRIDAARMETWVTELVNLGTRSHVYTTPDKLLGAYFSEEAPDFLKKLLSRAFLQEICVGDWREKLKEAAATIADVAYFHDWKKWELGVETNWKATPKPIKGMEMPMTAAEVRPRLATWATANLDLD